MKHVIQSQRKQLNFDIDNTQTGTNNKYMIQTVEQTQQDPNNNLTFMDILFKQLVDCGVSEQMMDAIAEYLKLEQFDTESVDMDTRDYLVTGSNIYNFVNDKSTFEYMADEIAFSKG